MSGDLGDEFAEHADESLAIAQETFPATAEAWLCGPGLPVYGWGESVTADHDSVTVHLNQGWRWAADLELDRDQARLLGQQLLELTEPETVRPDQT